MPRESFLLLYFIALRRKIEDEEFLTHGHWMEKTEKRRTHRKGIPQGAPNSPGKHLSARSQPMDRNKKEICLGSVRYADGEYTAEQTLGLPFQQ